MSHPAQPNTPTPTRASRRRRFALALPFLALSITALGMPASIRIPAVHDHGAGNPADEAEFSHQGHDQFTCWQCHPSVFPQRKLGFTHADMARGEYCGACHNGRVAFGPKDKGVSCETCHTPRSQPDIDEDELW